MARHGDADISAKIMTEENRLRLRAVCANALNGPHREIVRGEGNKHHGRMAVSYLLMYAISIRWYVEPSSGASSGTFGILGCRPMMSSLRERGRREGRH